jgi:glycosyltransferase involved in cell wall biosynthesis
MNCPPAPRSLPVTVLLAARNEAINLRNCLSSLAPARRVVVLDSHSTDGTPEIALAHGAEVVQFDYRGGYPKKGQWALDTLDLRTDWILLVDADEQVPDALWCEIADGIAPPARAEAFLITKGFHFLGRRLRFGGFSHSAVLLFRRGHARFEQLADNLPTAQDMEVHERMIVSGRLGRLRTPLVHHDFKGLEAYLARHNLYSSWEAALRWNYLRSGAYGRATIPARLWGNAQERRRFLKQLAIRMPFEPALWFCYHYLLRLGFLEGRRGLIASQIRASYIAQVRAKCYELRLRQEASRRAVAGPVQPEPRSLAHPTLLTPPLSPAAREAGRSPSEEAFVSP